MTVKTTTKGTKNTKNLVQHSRNQKKQTMKLNRQNFVDRHDDENSPRRGTKEHEDFDRRDEETSSLRTQRVLWIGMMVKTTTKSTKIAGIDSVVKL